MIYDSFFVLQADATAGGAEEPSENNDTADGSQETHRSKQRRVEKSRDAATEGTTRTSRSDSFSLFLKLNFIF